MDTIFRMPDTAQSPTTDASQVPTAGSATPQVDGTTLESLETPQQAPSYSAPVPEAQTAEDLLAAAGFGQQPKQEEKKGVAIPPTPVLKMSAAAQQDTPVTEVTDTPSETPAVSDPTAATPAEVSAGGVEDLSSLADQLEKQVSEQPATASTPPIAAAPSAAPSSSQPSTSPAQSEQKQPDTELQTSSQETKPDQAARVEPAAAPPTQTTSAAAEPETQSAPTPKAIPKVSNANVIEGLPSEETTPPESKSSAAPADIPDADKSDDESDEPAVPAADGPEPVALTADGTVTAVSEATAQQSETTPVEDAAPEKSQDTTTPPAEPTDPQPAAEQHTEQSDAPAEQPPADEQADGADAAADPTTTNTQYQSFLDLLIAKKLLTEEAANKVSVENISTGISVEEIIERDKLVDIPEMTEAKAEFHGVPYVNLKEVGIFPEALNKIPESVARRYSLLPFAFDPDTNKLSVAMMNPLDLGAISFAEQKTGVNIQSYYAIPSEVERLIAEYYSHSLSSEVTAALEQTKQLNQQKQKKQQPALSGETIRQAPITKIVQTIVSFAMKARASDIHIEPLEDRTRVRYRIDGILMEKLILPASVHEAVVSRIKILSGLKIDEKRIPQDGRFNFQTDDAEVDLRVSTLPTVDGEKIVMRLLKKDAKVPDLPELGLNGLALKNLKDSMLVPHGIILVTGPTGSGKTTTLYSVLDKLNTPKVNIMTLEDPVEYQMVGVNQVQINPQAGLTFASGLRSFLRQDPNIIMVGEIRDSETAELAVQASLTGHLVFSTLHTSSAAGAIPRLLDMGAEPFLLASSMTLIMAQRVMRVLNPDFKEEYTPDPKVIEDIKQVLGSHFDLWCQKHNKKPEEIKLFRSKSDRPHTEPEYKGRIAIFEVLRVTEEIGKMILKREPATDIEKLGQKNGMLLMKQDGYLKVLEGITTPEEVLRVAQV